MQVPLLIVCTRCQCTNFRLPFQASVFLLTTWLLVSTPTCFSDVANFSVYSLMSRTRNVRSVLLSMGKL
ncbi:hypothetical protein P879_11245 [Paragonimus westermani]|uniref:Uncharacterized protein n=1 Tax=Paragonimus westermani TaxID=34504 RepID=A0A8T0DG48_9TREM|nr:hypothetical protein P879_11245 [Paragonimus westermani]